MRIESIIKASKEAKPDFCGFCWALAARLVPTRWVFGAGVGVIKSGGNTIGCLEEAGLALGEGLGGGARIGAWTAAGTFPKEEGIF